MMVSSNDGDQSTPPSPPTCRPPPPNDHDQLTRGYQDLERKLKAANDKLKVMSEHSRRDQRQINSLKQKVDALELGRASGAHRLEVLGKGSFGTVYHYPTHSTVYKSVQTLYSDPSLYEEFTLYSEVYTATGRSAAAWSFCTPRVWAYWRASTSEVNGPEASPYRPKNSPRTSPPSGDPRSSVWAEFTTSTFVMDLIPSLPPVIADTYVKLFMAPNIQESSPRIRLLRLYFGRDSLPAQTTDHHPALAPDPPLDLTRYQKLREAVDLSMPMPEDVARGMGQLLARLHWAVGVNGCDVELVLGSVPVNGQAMLQCHVLDFNQCQRWLTRHPLQNLDADTLTIGHYTDLVDGGRRLATLIAGQELYYPRPHHTTLYKPFKTAYVDTVDELVRNADPSDQYGWHNRIRDGVASFFDTYEEIDTKKRARRSRLFGP